MESTSYALVFYGFSALALAAAAVVVFARNILYSAFALLATLFGIAALYAMLGADFLAAAQLVIYIGGILVLILFGVLLTQRVAHLHLRVTTRQALPALVAAALVALVLWVALVQRAPWPAPTPRPMEPTTAALGEALLGKFLLPFEVVSIALLAALVGAVYLTRAPERDR
ncbi:MAG TPA: NADH-quinone oxidoreductase subunit J [Acidobacteriota bacterium]|jgi:NADH-quinone oxidoreductase subunit J